MNIKEIANRVTIIDIYTNESIDILTEDTPLYKEDPIDDGHGKGYKQKCDFSTMTLEARNLIPGLRYKLILYFSDYTSKVWGSDKMPVSASITPAVNGVELSFFRISKGSLHY